MKYLPYLFLCPHFVYILCLPDEDFDPTLEPINKTWSKIRTVNYHTDMHIVNSIQEGITNKEYFYQPPVNMFTLSFNDSHLEERYRDHYMEDQHQQHTISAPKYHSFLEILISFLVFAIISIYCFVVFDRQLPWIVVFIISFLIEVLNLIRAIMTIKYAEQTDGGLWFKLSQLTSGWYFRNFLGAVVASIPVVAVYSNFSCSLITGMQWSDRYFCFCIVVSLLHFTNFTTLSSWMKTSLAFLSGLALILAMALVQCQTVPLTSTEAPVSVTRIVTMNSTNVNSTIPNISASDSGFAPLYSGIQLYEIILDTLLLVILIGILNRDSEISYRLNYHGDAQAWEYKQIMQENKDQADWLLHNIIPQHVSDLVRKTSKYSKNHKDVGVIFAAIVNFNEIYDETFEGGREFLRVLNELVSDYEDLLDDARFKDVEKIKTISSTFMAASGLNEAFRAQNKNPHAHLYALMQFATELQKAIKRFNDSIFNFDFILNIGYNYGEVTAGVIGTTKLLYDIWGDTVNIASRMYSTGVKERIQTPESAAKLLGDMMEFEYRGEISVKGKGVMKTYLFKNIKEGAHWE